MLKMDCLKDPLNDRQIKRLEAPPYLPLREEFMFSDIKKSRKEN